MAQRPFDAARDLLRPDRATAPPAPPRRPPSGFSASAELSRRLRLESLETRRLPAIITVTSLADNTTADGLITLREAVNAANNNVLADAVEGVQAGSGVDVIKFAAGLSGGTIKLTQGELALTQAVSVDGANLSGGLTIDGDGASRVFNITAPTGDFTFAGITITKGATFDPQSPGGGIRSMTVGTLTFDNATLSDNRTFGEESGGGGVFAAGPVVLDRTVINGNSTSGNRAPGGGVLSATSVSVTMSTVSNNLTFGGASFGAGLAAINSVVPADAQISIADSMIQLNAVISQQAKGGGAFSSGDLHLVRSLVSGNALGAPAPQANNLQLVRTLLSGNQSGSRLEQTYFDSSHETPGASLEDYGEYGGQGAGVYAGQDFYADYATLDSNLIVGRDSGRGGGAFAGASAFINDSAINDNTVSGPRAAGGGVYSRGSVTLNRSAVTGNLLNPPPATSTAGSDLALIHTLLSGQQAVGGATPYLDGSGEIFGAAPDDYGEYGGGAGVYARIDFYAQSSLLDANKTYGEREVGGGAYAGRGAVITSSAVTNNSTKGLLADGGGVFIPDLVRVDTPNPETQVRLVLVNSVLSGNTVFGDAARGGGAFVPAASLLLATVVENRAGTGVFPGGGGLYVTGRVFGSLNQQLLASDFRSSIVAKNTSGAFAPDIAIADGVPSVRNYLLLGNNEGSESHFPASPTADATGSLIGSDAAPIDPLVGPLQDNGGGLLPGDVPMPSHELLVGSPAIDAGNPALLAGQFGTPRFDGRGHPFSRVVAFLPDGAPRADMGAFETSLVTADFEPDDDVDGADFLAWQRGFGKLAPTALRDDGDANGDGDVDKHDLAAWINQFGEPPMLAPNLAPAVESALAPDPGNSAQPPPTATLDATIADAALADYAIAPSTASALAADALWSSAPLRRRLLRR